MPYDFIPIKQQGESFIEPRLTQKITVGAANTQSAAISRGSLVRLCATSACHVLIGDNPVTDTNSMYLPANVPEYFAVQGGQKIGVIQNTAGGFLFVTTGSE